MAQQARVEVPAETWTQITDGDVTSLTFQVFGTGPIFVAGTVGAVAPSNTEGALRYRSGQGELNKALTAMFPGVAATRVYVYSANAAVVEVGNA